VRLWAAASKAVTGKVFVSSRAEEVALTTSRGASMEDCNCLAGVVQSIASEGPMTRLTLDCGFQLTALITRHAFADMHVSTGLTATVLLKPSAIHLMACSGSQ
jgi:ABC-type molybdate transport system ATPase subunit